ncbi:DNA-binding transcriptional regulator, XRE-family HTH domain [Anaerosphaera aminiphila DSM 21120]|uniref:DNA-binding transcriptional regulator, XRE-family HTH domain n=1 Tax=Anaerosphaera aminiphila DSM 21120 TaxID=1120995 RepID=A0A1M5SJ45_9FIRM|nr:helix-turn-helix transcriptional regulator [Anaerosphaera aminiphila]SHH38607.1 DNA-binding transcriptional regulator, XRE-family HTH domain [Anaerosphaera aminiphila DSM 21120]
MEKREIGETIRVLRKNKGVTQEQLAEILEVSTPAVSKWENSQTYPDISLLLCVDDVLRRRLETKLITKILTFKVA